MWMPGVDTQRRTQDMNVVPPFCISQLTAEVAHRLSLSKEGCSSCADGG